MIHHDNIKTTTRNAEFSKAKFYNTPRHFFPPAGQLQYDPMSWDQVCVDSPLAQMEIVMLVMLVAYHVLSHMVGVTFQTSP